TPSAHVLDNGTGSGMLTSILKNAHPSIPITASDISRGMLETVVETAKKAGWKGVETRVLDAQRLDGLPDASFSHVVCSFVVSFVPDPAAAIKEMHRVARPNGALGIATWSRISWTEPWERARRTVEPGYKIPTFLHPKATEKEDVKALLEEAGWQDVKVWEFE
ncbi:S-adenosyl-L-methionine-dependent methyltransferase, partial [Saccharata proteae CBS 121410]